MPDIQTEIAVTSSNEAGRKAWIGFAVLALPTLLVSMDATVTFLALPALTASLKPTGSELLWITDMYTFTEAGFLIIMGALGDRVGRKRLLTIGFITFAIASVIAAFASTPILLITARGLLGITGAIILPCTLSLIRNLFPDDRQRVIAFGIYTACYSGGTMLGPLVGGILLTHFWWGSVFLIGVPLMVLFLIASFLLPEYRDRDAKQFSLVSALLLLTGMLSLTYGIKRVAEHGTLDMLSVTTMAAGVVVTGIFLYTQKVIRNPLIDLRLFRDSAFSATLAVLFLALFCWSGVYLYIAQYLQLVLEFSPLKAGLLTLLPAAVTMVGCMLAPQTLRWLKRSSVIVVGNLIMLAGMLILTQLDATPQLLVLILACSFLGLGSGLVVTLGIDLIVSVAPPEQAGAVSGISETSTTFGSAFGVALLGSVGTAMYHSQMADKLSEATYVSKETFNTLGGAFAESKKLPVESGAALLNYAKSSFISSFHLAAGISAILIFFIVIIFLIALRNKTVDIQRQNQ